MQINRQRDCIGPMLFEIKKQKGSTTLGNYENEPLAAIKNVKSNKNEVDACSSHSLFVYAVN